MSMFKGAKARTFKPFVPKCKTGAVPVQDLDADAVATQKDKEVARKWVGVEEGFHQNGQGINGLAHVCSDH